MSLANRYEGSVTIDPPLNWAQIQRVRGIKNVDSDWSVSLEINEVTTDTETGTTTVKTCSAIVPARPERYKGYDIPEVLQAIIDLNPENTFDGYIERDGESVSDLVRYVVKDRKLVEIRPEIIWPEP